MKTREELLTLSDKYGWWHVSYHQSLSEDFIREFKDKVSWGVISIHQNLSEDFIREFKDEVDWTYISRNQILSEDFIREFKEEVDWYSISMYQTLSEGSIREFKGKVYWGVISRHQNLSEDLIREFKDKVDWGVISRHQNLSEDFIREFKEEVHWQSISKYQNLSEDFAKEFKLAEQLKIQKLHKEINNKKTAIEYAELYDLEHDEEYLYTYRNLKGIFSPNGRYKLNTYYKDWHCDPRYHIENSYGFGIWALKEEGDHICRVRLEDFVIEAIGDETKARVWGFELLRKVDG